MRLPFILASVAGMAVLRDLPMVFGVKARHQTKSFNRQRKASAKQRNKSYAKRRK